MLKTFIFDLGNVLLLFSHERMFAQVGALCGRSSDEVRHALSAGDLGAEFERGRISAEELQKELERRLRTSFEHDPLHRALANIFSPNDGMLAAVDVLRSRGFRLVLLSNTNEIHIQWIRTHYDVLNRFDACILSHEAGLLKPEPAIYETAIRAANCAPDECFYTDDIPAYVSAGRACGLQAEVFTGEPAFRAQLAERGILLGPSEAGTR